MVLTAMSRRPEMCQRLESKKTQKSLKAEKFNQFINSPGQHGDLCGKRGRESRVHRSYNPSSTYYTRSCVNPRASCIEQRSSLSAEASTMAAIYDCPHHQDLQHPIKKKSNFESDPESKTQNKPQIIAFQKDKNDNRNTHISSMTHKTKHKISSMKHTCVTMILRFLGLISRTVVVVS